MRLFEIVDGVQHILELGTDRETGEISNFTLKRLDELELTLDEKLTNTALYLKGVEAERDAVKKAAQELSDRAKIHTRQADRLRKYLSDNMERVGHEGLSDPRVKLGWRSSTAVVVDADASLPVELLCVKTAPDKKAIGDLLKAGTEVEGCRLETRRNLQVK
ncbi:MAG TPA: siphovirus Gp157 family protein [Gemmatimonadetes bacterium]|nr:siphovirus Gp157 family protein [Gemmatimonadota bacterium]